MRIQAFKGGVPSAIAFVKEIHHLVGYYKNCMALSTIYLSIMVLQYTSVTQDCWCQP